MNKQVKNPDPSQIQKCLNQIRQAAKNMVDTFKGASEGIKETLYRVSLKDEIRILKKTKKKVYVSRLPICQALSLIIQTEHNKAYHRYIKDDLLNYKPKKTHGAMWWRLDDDGIHRRQKVLQQMIDKREKELYGQKGKNNS